MIPYYDEWKLTTTFRHAPQLSALRYMPTVTPTAGPPAMVYSPSALDAGKLQGKSAHSFPGSPAGTGLRAEAAAFLTANGAAILRMCPIFLTFPSGEDCALFCYFGGTLLRRAHP